MTSSQLLDFLRTEGIAWVQSQRGTLRPLGRPLGTHESQQLASYFDGDHLATVRITQVPSISNPPFYATLAQQGIGIPLDFTVMAGITFIDTVAISRANPLPRDQWLPLLFHELVHVVQYRILGLQEFIRRYINGWTENGFRYEAIPLERDAYELDARYRAGPPVFSAPAAVALQLA